MMSAFPPIPEKFLERMQHLLGVAFPAFLASQSEEAAAGLRANTLKLPAAALADLSPVPLKTVDWAPEGFWLPGAARDFFSGRNPLHAAGAYYLQEPSAMAAAALTGTKPGERILDISAAPGGKSTHLAAQLAHEGLLVANEIHPARVWTLAENLERFGVRNAIITQETPERLANHFGAYFDRVLVDAPCSGEGMFRKSPAARQAWSEALVQGCAIRQADILDQAARLVRPGGMLVYSTCTFAPEEDEETIAAFAARQASLGRHFSMAAADVTGTLSPGQSGWVQSPTPLDLQQAIRIWPHEQGGDGHFIARLVLEDGPASRPTRPFNPQLPRAAAQLWEGFVQEHLTTSRTFQDRILNLQGSYLYAAPHDAPDLQGLRVIHAGWWLGELKKNRIEPAHALALGLHAEDARNVHLLSAAQVEHYLAGESLQDMTGKSGWTLVALPLTGFILPLGWAKSSNGVLKNAYPKGLRTRG